VLPNKLDINRLGIVATRRIGGATCRNRSKRIVREIYRLNKNQHDGLTVDIVVMPRPGFSDIPINILQTDYLSTLRRYAQSKE
jgi:ribonuclease P protein component